MAPRGTLIPFLAAVGATWLNRSTCDRIKLIVIRSSRPIVAIHITSSIVAVATWLSSTRLQLYCLRFSAIPCLPHKRSTMYFLLSVDGAVEVLKRMSTGSRVYVDTSIESIGTRPSNVNRRYWKCGHFYVDVRAATFGAEEESTRRRIDVGLCGWFSLPLFSPLYSCTFLLGRRKVQE